VDRDEEDVNKEVEAHNRPKRVPKCASVWARVVCERCIRVWVREGRAPAIDDYCAPSEKPNSTIPRLLLLPQTLSSFHYSPSLAPPPNSL
jgi:hypothetical protein